MTKFIFHHADVVVGVTLAIIRYIHECVCASVCVSSLKQKSLDVSSPVLADRCITSTGDPFYLRSKA